MENEAVVEDVHSDNEAEEHKEPQDDQELSEHEDHELHEEHEEPVESPASAPTATVDSWYGKFANPEMPVDVATVPEVSVTKEPETPDLEPWRVQDDDAMPTSDDEGPDFTATPFHDARQIEIERNDLLAKLDELRMAGVRIEGDWGHTSDVNELRSRVHRATTARQRTVGVTVSRKLLIGLVGGVEWLNTSYDPMGIKLVGWSDQVQTNITDYDEVLGRIWEKYLKHMGEINPVLELAFSLALSAAMYHMQQQAIEKATRETKALMHKMEQLQEQQRAMSQPPPPQPKPAQPPKPDIPSISSILSKINTDVPAMTPPPALPPVTVAPTKPAVPDLSKVFNLTPPGQTK
jgi:hypothetical protein